MGEHAGPFAVGDLERSDNARDRAMRPERVGEAHPMNGEGGSLVAPQHPRSDHVPESSRELDVGRVAVLGKSDIDVSDVRRVGLAPAAHRRGAHHVVGGSDHRADTVG